MTAPAPPGPGRHLVLLLAAALLGACAGPARLPPLPGAGVAAGLVGVWCNSNDGGRSCWAYDEFRSDGRFEACGQTDDDPRQFHGEGRYTVDGSRMCYVVERSSPNFWLRPGSRYCTEILAVSPTAHRYRDLDTGAEFELTRAAPSAMRCGASR